MIYLIHNYILIVLHQKTTKSQLEVYNQTKNSFTFAIRIYTHDKQKDLYRKNWGG